MNSRRPGMGVVMCGEALFGWSLAILNGLGGG
jgi:hypothetical protein